MESLLLMVGGVVLMTWGASSEQFEIAMLGTFLLGWGVGTIFSYE